MGNLKNIANKKESAINSNEDFWKWFANHAKTFHKVVKQHTSVEEDFFDKLAPKLNELKEGINYVTGMLDEHTAELIFTADGIVKNLVFTEELVAAAPQIPGWKFTAHKEEAAISKNKINVDDYTFHKDNMFFYPEENPAYPDEISLVITHDDVTEENVKTISTGVYVFLDNYLGELRAATAIDSLDLLPTSEAKGELIPIEKLKSYLIWREKEFLEKYDSVTIVTSVQQQTLMQTTLENGNPLFATINLELLKWDNKSSHPWILRFETVFDGSGNSGLPDEQTLLLLNDIEDDMLEHFADVNGQLYIGRETVGGLRTNYFACNEFRECSKIAHQIVQRHKHKVDIIYEIFKDKYWQTFRQYEAVE
ncbi:DUF695 domain-containing protein [Pedobacter sp. PWIIR3]